MTPSQETASSLLKGIRILSLAEQYPGPYATLLLADLGAEVVMIERPGIGDPSRIAPDFFRSLARNKYSVCLDLKAEEGRGELSKMLGQADVLVEGYRPGVMRRLGFDYETVASVNPRIVYVSISGFGQDGPYRDRLAHDLSYQAISGMLFDREGKDVVPPAVSFADLTAGTFAALAIMTALFDRERTGRGRYVDVAMADCLVSWMTTYLGPLANHGAPLAAMHEPAYGVFGCADGRAITLSIAHEDYFWQPLCDLTGMPEKKALKHHERIAQRLELREMLQGALGAKPLACWAEQFDRTGIPWSPMLGLADVLKDPHFQARGMFAEVRRGDGSIEHHVMQPIKYSGFASEIRLPAPNLGEHNGKIPMD